MQTEGGVAQLGRGIQVGGEYVGSVCSSTWSPYLQCGVAIARMDRANIGPGSSGLVDCVDGHQRDARICALPMYDEQREIPRGLCVDIPLRRAS